MALPSCWPVLNLDTFTNIKAQIEAAGKSESQADIQAAIDDAFAQINGVQAAVTSQLAALNPILGLLSAPVDPTAAVTWIATFINDFLGPYILPIAKYEAQAAALAVEVAAVVETINAVQALRPEIVITVPAFPDITCAV